MPHRQQALLDSLNQENDECHIIREGRTHIGHVAPDMVLDSDVVVAVSRYEKVPCPHLTLRSHVEGDYICATDGWPECHQKFRVQMAGIAQ